MTTYDRFSVSAGSTEALCTLVIGFFVPLTVAKHLPEETIQAADEWRDSPRGTAFLGYHCAVSVKMRAA